MIWRQERTKWIRSRSSGWKELKRKNGEKNSKRRCLINLRRKLSRKHPKILLTDLLISKRVQSSLKWDSSWKSLVSKSRTMPNISNGSKQLKSTLSTEKKLWSNGISNSKITAKNNSNNSKSTLPKRRSSKRDWKKKRRKAIKKRRLLSLRKKVKRKRKNKNPSSSILWISSMNKIGRLSPKLSG